MHFSLDFYLYLVHILQCYEQEIECKEYYLDFMMNIFWEN